MSYRVFGREDGALGAVFQTEADAQAVIEEIVAEGAENEANWLLELAHATEEGGSVNMDDQEFVRRILAAAKEERRQVAMECARERIHSAYRVLKSREE